MRIFLIFLFVFAAGAGQEPPEIIPPGQSQGRALKPLRLSNTVFVDRQINLQTELAVDDENTAQLISAFGNGQFRSMRVSSPGVVKQAFLYKGWPYVVDQKGHLYAMDLSWRTFLRNKIPIVVRRLSSNFRYASGTGIGLILFAWLSNITSSAEGGQYGPWILGTAGFFTVYLSDATLTMLMPAHHKPNFGGNFFRRKIATGVTRVVDDPDSDDKVIRYETSGPDKKTRLSELAPSYTKKTSCLYDLTKLLNDGYWEK